MQIAEIEDELDRLEGLVDAGPPDGGAYEVEEARALVRAIEAAPGVVAPRVRQRAHQVLKAMGGSVEGLAAEG
jgi:hypothetical protein